MNASLASSVLPIPYHYCFELVCIALPLIACLAVCWNAVMVQVHHQNWPENQPRDTRWIWWCPNGARGGWRAAHQVCSGTAVSCKMLCLYYVRHIHDFASLHHIVGRVFFSSAQTIHAVWYICFCGIISPEHRGWLFALLLSSLSAAWRSIIMVKIKNQLVTMNNDCSLFSGLVARTSSYVVAYEYP